MPGLAGHKVAIGEIAQNTRQAHAVPLREGILIPSRDIGDKLLGASYHLLAVFLRIVLAAIVAVGRVERRHIQTYGKAETIVGFRLIGNFVSYVAHASRRAFGVDCGRLAGIVVLEQCKLHTGGKTSPGDVGSLKHNARIDAVCTDFYITRNLIVGSCQTHNLQIHRTVDGIDIEIAFMSCSSRHGNGRCHKANAGI